MGTNELLIATGLTSAQIVTPERRLIFIESISKVSSENIENICQHLRMLHPKNAETTNGCGDQLHGTTVDLNAPTEKVANTIGRYLTATHKN